LHNPVITKRIALLDFSNDELIRLAEVLQGELKKYDDGAVAELAAEPLVLLPSELINEQKHKVKTRPRRSKPHHEDHFLIAEEIPSALLERLIEPLVILPDPRATSHHKGPTVSKYLLLINKPKTFSTSPWKAQRPRRFC
jgi:hypothetical protein